MTNVAATSAAGIGCFFSPPAKEVSASLMLCRRCVVCCMSGCLTGDGPELDKLSNEDLLECWVSIVWKTNTLYNNNYYYYY